jgi:iron(III) transport system ATP-binding protein
MIQVKHLRKNYWVRDGRVEAVDGVDFEVPEGEIFMLLGASGCGKTTTLRCIAGLEIPDDGEISLGGQVVFGDHGETLVPVYQRGVGMVFQSYAIWPHLTVFENVAYPLLYGLFKIPKSEVKPRVRKVLSLVGLAGFEDRPAPLLSGGQQQRIALARALVYEPKVLLLDEPLSNLDAKLRAEMRVELRRLIKELKVTSLYVTHDQEEALVLADRIAVMASGRIIQIGTPREVYSKPGNDLVAAFIGTANLLRAAVAHCPLNGGEGSVSTAIGTLYCSLPTSVKAGQQATLMFRPEDIVIQSPAALSQENTFPGIVEQSVFVGGRFQCQFLIDSLRIHGEVPKSSAIESGQRVLIEIPRHTIHVLP